MSAGISDGKVIDMRNQKVAIPLQVLHFGSPLRRFCGLVLWVMVLGLFISAARAGGPEKNALSSELYSMYRISLTQSDIRILLRDVIGDENAPESAIVQSLYAGYVQAWNQSAMIAREDVRLIKEQGRNKGIDFYRTQTQPQIAARQKEWAEEAFGLEEQFFTDVKTILTDVQLARWGKFEQGRRRRMLLRPNSRLAGENVDLIEIVEKMKLDDENAAKVAKILDDYGDELDVAIQARRVRMQDINRRLAAISSGQSGEDGERLYREELRTHKALREINERYAGLITDALAPEIGAEFKKAFDRVRFPRIFAYSQAERYLAKVRGLDDLTRNQTSSIDRIEQEYQSFLDPIVQRLIALRRARDEETRTQFRLANAKRSGTGGAVPSGDDGSGIELALNGAGSAPERINEERNLWQKRRDLETKLIDDVYLVLNEAQKEKVPKSNRFVQPGGMPTGPLERGGDDNDGG